MLLAILCGLLISVIGSFLILQFKKAEFEKLGQEIIHHAETEAHKRQLEQKFNLKQNELEHREALEKLKEQKIQKIALREEKLDKQWGMLDKKTQEADRKEKELFQREQRLIEAEHQLDKEKSLYITKLQNLSGLSCDEAKLVFFDQLSNEIKTECTAFLAKQKKEMDEIAEKQAVEVMTSAINRLAIKTTSEVASIVVLLPSQEMKRRVIGREGRNIRILEQTTGVNFVIDDTPNAVVISGFDPIRKEIARLTLKDLIQDGRIHPTRIEEAVSKAENKIRSQIKEYGEKAALQAGLLTLHPKLVEYLGHLNFLYCNGQNVLEHSLEVSHLMGIMAAELKLDSAKAKKMGLLHDIGKAAPHEKEGSHALIGQQLALKYGEDEEIANGIGCHHEEIAPLTSEASLCCAANRLSSHRPGARPEAWERSFKRAAKLEQISRQFDGVEKAYAMYAGKELRVIVHSDKYDDDKTLWLAREITKQIEKEISYHDRIKVTVIREKKVVEYAI